MRKLSLNLWVWVALLVSVTVVCSGCIEEERNGLLKLKPLLKTISSWVDDDDIDCCGWERVKCDNNTQRRIIRLSLSYTYLGATDKRVLNASMFLPFQQLQYLDLSVNGISDLQNVQDFRRLKKLEVLILKDNSFNNTIFQSLSALTSLAVLDLSLNHLNGPLFDSGRELCKLKNLRELQLGSNTLSGTLPGCFKNLTSLKSLDLSANNLSNRNLHSFGLSTSIEYLSLSGNQQFDSNLILNSLVGHEFQFKYLDLSKCNLNISTTNLVKLLYSQPNLIVLDLSHNKLHGEFPNWYFKNNSSLEILILKSNSLTGHIHFPVGPLLNLKWFDVSFNHIQGELQPNIGKILPKLKCLNIANNYLGGGIPISIVNIKDLEILDFSNNNLSGELPETLGLGCKRLEYIKLSNNSLGGGIPPTIFDSSKLIFFDISMNQFSGYIPSNNFQSNFLQTFKIRQNHISGILPDWLGTKLTNSLDTLSMKDNNIEGYIPPQLCNLTSLRYLELSKNKLSGPMPSCLITMPSLTILHLGYNKLMYLPKVLSFSNSRLLTLDLSHNNLSGKIPSWLGLFSELRFLLLNHNHFSGLIPPGFCRMQMISIMDLSHNNLFGSIPLCFSKFKFGLIGFEERTHYESRFPNQITTSSEIVISDLIIQPTWLLNFGLFEESKYIEDVEFMMKSRSSSFLGYIITYMSVMDLSSNNLNGSIPIDIGSFTEILALNLSHNQLTGVIPSSLSNMERIESMDFSHNKLSGQIPSNLIRLTSLAVFTVAYNNLSGRVPEMVAQFSTFDETSYEGNPFLCGPPLLRKQCNISADPATSKDTSLVEQIDMFGIDPVGLLASFVATYVTCLLGFVFVLYLNPNWRRRWSHFINACLKFLFPFWSEAIDRSEI